MLDERPSVASSPSGLSHRVTKLTASKPDVNAKIRPLGSESPMIGETVRLGTKWTLRNKQSLINMQQNVSPRGNATPMEPNQTAQNEWNMNTSDNLRRPMITTATAQNNADRIKQFWATTHLASAIAKGDQLTAYAVEDIKVSITESESQGNKYDYKSITFHRIEK
jgi:hypothetical protein